jgi:hypothetical protein
LVPCAQPTTGLFLRRKQSANVQQANRLGSHAKIHLRWGAVVQDEIGECRWHARLSFIPIPLHLNQLRKHAKLRGAWIGDAMAA